MTTASWGNPDTASFAKVNLRLAAYDGHNVQVHKYVWRIIEHLFSRFGTADLDFSSLAPLDDPLRRGFKLRIPADVYEPFAEEVTSLMFDHIGDEFTFQGDAVLAETLATVYTGTAPELQEHQTAEEEPAEPAVDTVPAPMVPGDERFTLFIQHLTGAEPTGEWDDGTVAALKTYQERHGLASSGEVDTDTIATIVPRRPQWFRPGATGQYIKVIQAGFKAYGYYDQPITGVWGVFLSQCLRQFQADFRIHPRLRIGNPEFHALFNFESTTESTIDPQG